MTESELSKIEATFAIKLPSRYREWALRLPPPGAETKDYHYSCNDAERLIDENRDLRADGWYGQPWLPHLSCIDESDGNHSFIDVRDPDVVVFYANHDCGPYYDPDDYAACRSLPLEEYFGDDEFA